MLATARSTDPAAILKQDCQLRPHAADAAVGEVAIEELRWQCPKHIPLWNLSELGMIEGIQRLPLKLQPLPLADGKRLEQTQIEVVRATRRKRVASHCGSVRQ